MIGRGSARSAWLLTPSMHAGMPSLCAILVATLSVVCVECVVSCFVAVFCGCIERCLFAQQLLVGWAASWALAQP